MIPALSYGPAVVFETPKPTRLLRRILHLATRPDEKAIVLDFFAGSGSTMHAAFVQNAEDSGNRRCILVQLPEPLDTWQPRGTSRDVLGSRRISLRLLREIRRGFF
ncbi:MAG: hypothetical protein KJ000_02575 [Pirellulaceae bacterium]|nr:hypothetical protein [Pirellulaceae bacterium]